MRPCSARALPVKLLIAGGGTGGHVFPALAIAREWLARGNEREVVLVGTERGIEMKLVPQAGLPLETLRVAGLKGKGGATLVKNMAMLVPAMLDARRVLRKHKPVAAFGVGGYAAGPMMFATWLGRVPNVIFEPNAEPGFTNKVLARISTRIATGYEVSARDWGKKAIVTGCPVRPEFFAITPRRLEKPFRLLITGGSQGRCQSTAHLSTPWTASRCARMNWPSCIRLVSAITMQCVLLTRGAKSMRRLSRSSQTCRNALPGRILLFAAREPSPQRKSPLRAGPPFSFPSEERRTATNCATRRKCPARAPAA